MPSHLKTGDLVLAHCMIGLQKKETENKGKFVRYHNFGGETLVCEFVGNQQRFLSHDKVKKYEPIDHDQLMRECIAEFPMVANSVKFACEHLFDAKDYFGVEVNEADVTLSILNGAVTVEPAAFRGKSIVGIREAAGWEVSVWHDIPATRDDPPDVEQRTVNIVRGDLNVAQLVVQTIFNIKSSAYFENQSEARMAESMDEL